MDERSLLARLREFDEEALETVYDTYQPRLYRYAYRLLGDVTTAEDVVAETFHRLLRVLTQERGPRRHLQAWLYRVAHNLVVDHYRRRPLTAPLSPDDVYLTDVEGPAEELQRRLAEERVREALRQLTPDQRQVIVLKFLEGLNNKEVAEVLDKRVGAVKSLQHRALAALRRILDAWPAEDQEDAS